MKKNISEKCMNWTGGDTALQVAEASCVYHAALSESERQEQLASALVCRCCATP